MIVYVYPVLLGWTARLRSHSASRSLGGWRIGSLTTTSLWARADQSLPISSIRWSRGREPPAACAARPSQPRVPLLPPTQNHPWSAPFRRPSPSRPCPPARAPSLWAMTTPTASGGVDQLQRGMNPPRHMIDSRQLLVKQRDLNGRSVHGGKDEWKGCCGYHELVRCVSLSWRGIWQWRRPRRKGAGYSGPPCPRASRRPA